MQELKRSARPGKESDKIVSKIGKNIQTMQQIGIFILKFVNAKLQLTHI